MSKLWIELMSQAEQETQSLTYKIEKNRDRRMYRWPLSGLLINDMTLAQPSVKVDKKKKTKLQKLRWIQRNVHVAIFYLILW